MKWYTIDEFADITPIDLLHKEQENTGKASGTVQGAEAANVVGKGASEGASKDRKWENVHVLCRGEFTLGTGQGEKSLRLKISGDDHYKLYLDGLYLTEGPAPAWHSHYYYNEVELGRLPGGAHVLGVHLYYQGLVNRVFNSGDLRLALAMELYGDDGVRIPLKLLYRRIESFSGKPTGYDTQYLEDFDSRSFPQDWNLPDRGAGGTEGEKPMVEARWADYVLFPQPTKMLSHEIRKPKAVKALPDGSLLVDAGEEITGSLLLSAKGKAGQKIQIDCGEELENGQVRSKMRCNCDYHEVWTLGDGECALEPYDYKGFRYASLVPDEGVEINRIELFVRHYPMDETLCTLRSDKKELEQIFQICKNAVRNCTQEGFLDCPTREKGQYLGDAVITAHTHLWLTGETDMLVKCIDQFAQSAQVCPGLLAVVPGGLMQEIADFSLLYHQLILLYYQFTGDKEVVGRYYQTADGILKHFSQYERADGLLEQVADKWNLVDWPENLRDGYDFPLTRPVVGEGCHNVINALYLGAKEGQNRMAAILGREMPYDTAPLKKAYFKAFYRKEKGLLADSETSSHCALHSNVYPLYFGLLPKERQTGILDHIEKKGFTCGVMMSYFVLKVLAGAGRYETVYRLLLNEGEHGWVQMLREGASCCFESWGKEQKWNTSLCHPWASAPIPVLLEDIAGISPQPDAPGGYRFEPHIPKETGYFKVTAPFRGKMIQVMREISGDEKITLTEL